MIADLCEQLGNAGNSGIYGRWVILTLYLPNNAGPVRYLTLPRNEVLASHGSLAIECGALPTANIELGHLGPGHSSDLSGPRRRAPQVSIVKDHQLAIGETLDIGLDPARADFGCGIKGSAGVLGIDSTSTAMGANLLRRISGDSHAGISNPTPKVTESGIIRTQAI